MRRFTEQEFTSFPAEPEHDRRELTRLSGLPLPSVLERESKLDIRGPLETQFTILLSRIASYSVTNYIGSDTDGIAELVTAVGAKEKGRPPAIKNHGHRNRYDTSVRLKAGKPSDALICR